MDLEEYGHVGVFGASGSGKTTYIKSIIEKLETPPEKVHVYTATGYQWHDVSNNVYDDFGNIGDVVSKINKEKAGGKGVIVFDDFNEVINTQSNPKYIGLFTHGRHAGVIVINGAHAPTSMGAKARKQLKYTVIMNTSDMENLTALSNYYLLGDTGKLIKAMDEKPDKYTACVIENETRKITYDKAGAVVNNIGNKNFENCNVRDQSQTNYNINQNIEVKNMVEANQIKNELSVVNYKHRLELKKLEKKEELKNLILKFGKTRQDYNRMVSLLNTFITNKKVTSLNYKMYLQPFMDHYYPGYVLGKGGVVEDNLVDIYEGNYHGIMIANGLKIGKYFGVL